MKAGIGARALATNFYESDGDGSDSAMNTGKDPAYGDSEQEMEQKLLDELHKCTVCNANKDPADRIPCLINKAGVHKRPNHQMITAWVCALVSLIIYSLFMRLIDNVYISVVKRQWSYSPETSIASLLCRISF